MNKEKLTDTLVLLAIPGVGRGRFKRLVNLFGSPAAVVDTSLADLEKVQGISRAVASAIKTKTDLKAAREMVTRIEKLGWTTLLTDNPEYPTELLRIDDHPPILFRLGQPTLPHEKMIAIVGTRRCSESNRNFTRKLAREMTEAGLIVVSGMAEGIDGAAHNGALDANGKTVAVWGTPLNEVFPFGHRELAKMILKTGTIYSEILPGVPYDKSSFPERNRIISGLSEGVIVVEAAEKSGALITAVQALDQGRELFAVPGSPDSRRSVGTNRLIKKGAYCLTETADLFEAIPRLTSQATASKLKELPEMTEMEQQMVDQLAEGPLQIDHLSRLTNLPVSDLMGYLLALELKGVVQEVSGKRFALCDAIGIGS